MDTQILSTFVTLWMLEKFNWFFFLVVWQSKDWIQQGMLFSFVKISKLKPGTKRSFKRIQATAMKLVPKTKSNGSVSKSTLPLSCFFSIIKSTKFEKSLTKLSCVASRSMLNSIGSCTTHLLVLGVFKVFWTPSLYRQGLL